MSYYVHGGTMTYGDYLTAKSFVADLGAAGRDSAQRVALEVSRSTREIIASNEALASANIRALEGGFDQLSFDLTEIGAGVDRLNATFHWGFAQMLGVMGHMADSIEELVRIAKTPVQTAAFNHFDIARDAYRQGLYQECIEELRKAIDGDHVSSGYKLEWRFHQMTGTLQLGFADCDMTLVDLPEAERSYLSAARYSRADYPDDAGRAYLAAGWAAYCQGKMPEALSHTEEALAICPTLGEALFQQAKVLMATGDVSGALPALGKAIDLDRLYAIKAAGDGDFQKHEQSLRDFLEAMRLEAYRRCLPAVRTTVDELDLWVRHDPDNDLLRPMLGFVAAEDSMPLLDVLSFADSLDETLAAARTGASNAHVQVSETRVVEVREEVEIRPKSLFRPAVTEVRTRTGEVEGIVCYDGLGNRHRLRFDGVYQRWSDAWVRCDLVRFYPDRTVLTAHAQEKNPKDLDEWFHREGSSDARLGRGRYTMVGGTALSFSAGSPDDTTDFEGHADDESLALTWRSKDDSESGTFTFVALKTN